MESNNHDHSVDIDQPNAAINNDAISRASSKKSGRISPVPIEIEVADTTTMETDDDPLKTNRNIKMTILVLIQVLVLLLIVGFLVASLVVNVLKKHILGGLEIWKWCLFALSVLCGFALVLWVYWPIMFLVERAFSLRQEVIYFVYGLRKSGAFFIWWVWVLLMWLILMEQQIHKRSPRATKVLIITTRTIISLAAASLAWVLLTIALRFLSIKCRFNRYIDKVRDASFQLDVLRCLAGEPIGEGKKRSNWFCMKKGNDEYFADNKVIRVYTFRNEKLSFLNWDYVFDHAHQRLELSTLKGIHNISTDEDAKKVALIIYGNIFKDRELPECITNEDLARFLKNEEQITRVFELFNGKKSIQPIDKNAFINWVIKVYQVRKILLQALSDNKTATKQLNVLLRAALVIMGTIAWLLWIDVLTTKLLAGFLTGLAGCVFIFGEVVKTTFQSIIFVFVVHPFDIGDKCIIDNTTLVVEQMNILTTIFLNENNEKSYYPNYVLSTKLISNSSRSSNIVEIVHFCIDVRTSQEKIDTLEEFIKRDLDSSNLVVEGFDGKDNMKMALQVSSKKEEQVKFSVKDDISKKEKTKNGRTRAILQLIKILQSINIIYSFPSTETLVLPYDARNLIIQPGPLVQS